MSSSVSSEHVFSQGGITISKCCSCLKGDIVEALQCVKCVIQHDLLFREPAPFSIVEVEETGNQGLEDVGPGGDSGELGEVLDVKDFLWEGLLIEDEDEKPMYYSE
jgi:hypothetical protein